MPVTPPASAPYLLTPTADGSVIGAAVTEADTLFPPFDGDTSKLPNRPADFGDDNPARFRFWHTAHQLEYIRDRGTSLSVSDGSASLSSLSIAIPPGAPADQQLHALIGADGRSVVILNDETPDTLQRLSLDTQRLVAGHPQFEALLAAPFGLASGGPAAARQAQKDRVDLLIASIDAAAGGMRELPGLDDTDPAALVNPASLIREQLVLFSARLDRMAIFDEVAIGERLAEFTERFERLRRHGTLPPIDPNATVQWNAISLDNNASLNAAYEIFANTEKRLLDIARISAAIVATGRFEGRILDLPNMTVTFQALENAEGEEEGRAMTEEIRQRNALLESYAEMQRLVNRVSSRFETPTKDNEDASKAKKALSDGLTGQELEDARKVAAMFSSLLVSGGGGVHPAEAAAGLTRPRMGVLDPAGNFLSYLKSQYDAFASSLAEATRTLDRDVQLLSDQVNAVSRQRNRHFDLATQTLTRMTDLVQTVSRGIN